MILPTSHRQAADQQLFRDLLDRLANGETSLHDWNLLNTRDHNRLLNQDTFVNALHLYARNDMANEYNTKQLRECHSPVLRIKSVNNCFQAQKANADIAGNLETVLYLAIG